MRSPDDLSKSIEVELLIDTGAMYTLLTSNMLEELGVKPTRWIKLRLADGKNVEKPWVKLVSS
ncbi:MAG: hypothetical protein GXO32_00165 [Crenarchaeota archaeon]|nr:hypothetical protein [Thermoproteota archaeon]